MGIANHSDFTGVFSSRFFVKNKERKEDGMKAIYWMILISFLLFGMNTWTGFGGEDYPEEELYADHGEDARVSIEGALDSGVGFFQPNLEESVFDGKEAAIRVPQFFADTYETDDGEAIFYFRYEEDSGVNVFGERNGKVFSFRPNLMGMEEDYYSGAYPEDAAWYLTSADLDGDNLPELLVAFHDGVIDGVLAVYRPYEFIEVGGRKQFKFQPKELGTVRFQNRIYVDEHGHIITPVGSQGLYEEHALEGGALKLLYSPSNP